MADDFITIATFLNSIEASMAKQRLEEEGIEAYVLDEQMGNILVGVLQVSTGGIRLQVKQADADVAQAILARDDSAEQESPE